GSRPELRGARVRCSASGGSSTTGGPLRRERRVPHIRLPGADVSPSNRNYRRRIPRRRRSCVCRPVASQGRGSLMARLVSVVSSATESVDGLGALPWVVGRSHDCDFPDQVRALPVCPAPRFAVDGTSREIDRLVRQTMTESISVYEVFDHVLERL